ncbi:MAG: hypothetical protein NXI13_16330 [Proteobacteria bacterium]|nr:hypothetical protein [Pseudomonadota bacterium]
MLAAALLNQADDEGFFKANHKLIQASCFPLREDSMSVHDSLISLERIGYVALFDGSDGKKYGKVVKFTQHQTISRPTPSKIKGLCKEPQDSLITHGVINEGSAEERKGKEGKGITPPSPPCWGDFEILYPDRGGKPKLLDKARCEFDKLISVGEKPEEIILGLKGYVLANKGKRLPMPADRFLGNRVYQEYQPIPENLNARVADGVNGGVWDDILKNWENRGQARAWLYPMRLERVSDGVATLRTDSEFIKDTFERDFETAVLKKWKLLDPAIKKLNVLGELKERTG